MDWVQLLWIILVMTAALYAGSQLILLGVVLLILRDWEPYQ